MSTKYIISLVLLLATTSGSVTALPRLCFGPCANLPLIKDQVLEMVSSPSVVQSQWPTVAGHLSDTNGTLIIRAMVLGQMNCTEQHHFARGLIATGQRITLEAGGAMCGTGEGNEIAESLLHKFQCFTEVAKSNNVSLIRILALESIYSRTYAGCPAQSHQATSNETADFASTLVAGLGAGTSSSSYSEGIDLFLYDALPHYSVSFGGTVYPTNNGFEKIHLELGTIIDMLSAAVASRNLKLSGYIADCPYEYSNELAHGFEKVAAALMVMKSKDLKFGKTFNSQVGGMTSGKEFFRRMMADIKDVAAAVLAMTKKPLHEALDVFQMETWYPHPTEVLPENVKFTSSSDMLRAICELAGNANC